ncbi:MAG: hypothetical protein ACOCV2_04420 [Persicimonas sp.]
MSQGKDKDLSDLKARLGLKKSKSGGDDEKAGKADESDNQGRASQDEQAGQRASQHEPVDGPGPGGAQQTANKSAPAGPPGAGGPPRAGGPPNAGPPAQGGRPAAQPGPSKGARPGPANRQGSGAAGSSAASSDSGRQGAQSASSSADASFGAQSARSGTSATGAAESEPEELDLDDDELSAIGGSTFSVGTIVLLIFMLAAGGLLGWFAASTLNERELYIERTEDASHIRDQLSSNLENLDEARSILEDLPQDDVDYEAAEKLAELELSPGEDIFASKQILLGSRLVGYVTGYMADAAMLEDLFEEHKRLTTDEDKEELEQLLEDNEVLEKDNFAVVFDFNHLSQTGGRENYVPKPGQIVTIPDADNLEEEVNDKGEIEVEPLNSDSTIKTPLQGLVPLDKGKIIETGGRTALQRYQSRVRQIQMQLEEIENYRESMMDQLDTLADRDSPPLFSL